MSDDSAYFSEEDIAALNRVTFRRTGQIAHVAGAALVVVGALGVIAWAWVAIRQQVRFGDGGGFSFNEDGTTGFADRIDVFSSTLGFVMEAALVIGVGVAVRLFSAVLLAREGVSLTSFEVGDPFPGAPEDDSAA